jgi:membrane protease YdiL (CAAX protease family)
MSGGRAAALLEILICSDYPTQIALAWLFAGLGYGPLVGQPLSVRYVALLSLTDTLLLLSLIAMFLSAGGERARDVFLGTRSPWREALAGLPLTFVALMLGVLVLTGIQQLAPWLHTVEHNPLQDLIRTPQAAAVFAVVVVVAGGIREEIQRAFLLRRFEQWVGGAGVGVVVTSAAFGAGHLVQGADAAIATGLLGAFWAVIYLRRRSVAAPIVSHSGFNLLQLAQFLVLGR